MTLLVLLFICSTISPVFTKGYNNLGAGIVFVTIAAIGLLIFGSMNILMETKTRATNTLTEEEVRGCFSIQLVRSPCLNIFFFQAAERDSADMDNLKLGNHAPAQRTQSSLPVRKICARI